MATIVKQKVKGHEYLYESISYRNLKFLKSYDYNIYQVVLEMPIN